MTRMGFLPLLVVVSLLAVTVFSQPQQFCGPQPCLIPTEADCETLVAEYDFQGSCCSLQPRTSVRGCRVEVWAGGNCFWTPRCGECDAADKTANGCGLVYSTTTGDSCKESDYNPFDESLKATCPPTAAPAVAEQPVFSPMDSASSFGMMTTIMVVLVAAMLNFA